MTERRETGTVTRVEAGRAAVRLRHQRAAACRGCTACRPEADGGFTLWLDSPGLQPGDVVDVTVPVPGPWRGILLVFALPLAALVAGLAAGSAWTGLHSATGLGPDAAGAALGLGAAAVTFLAALVEERRFSRRHPPRVVGVRPPGVFPGAGRNSTV